VGGSDAASLPLLSTERLALRPVEEADLGLLIELNSDPAVMAHILGRAATPDETRAEWSRRLTRQSNTARGLGYWLGFEAGDFVGWWSASWFAPRPEVSGIGYRLRREGWGRGLATEGAQAMIDQAFADAGVDRVFASTMAVNTGSRRVLEKLSMTHTASWLHEGDDPIPGTEHGEVGYELPRAHWRATGYRQPSDDVTR
jgi:RimJ/RimL family protein N-acetyltransferase